MLWLKIFCLMILLFNNFLKRIPTPEEFSIKINIELFRLKQLNFLISIQKHVIV